ncbi:MAG: aminomethyltransferase family protein [Lysobacterales bacterium]
MLIQKNGAKQQKDSATTRSTMVSAPASAGGHTSGVVNQWPVVTRFDGENPGAGVCLADMSHCLNAMISGTALTKLRETKPANTCLAHEGLLIGILSDEQALAVDVGGERSNWPAEDYVDMTDGTAVFAMWGHQATAVVAAMFSDDVVRADLASAAFTPAMSSGVPINVFRLAKQTPGFLLTCDRSLAQNLFDRFLKVSDTLVGVEACSRWLMSEDTPAPVNRTPVHQLQVDAGGIGAVFGSWERIVHFGDPEGEAHAAHEHGIIMDSSSLGKFMISGPDASKVIARVTTKNVDTLKPGKIAYYVSCDESGHMLDDGTVIRRSQYEYYLSTGTLRSAAFESWCKQWCANENWDYSLANLSQNYAAFSIAGPHSREILNQLTDADVSAQAFPFMNGIDAMVAGVPCQVLRIGFLGELGYEFHVPAAQANHLWRALEKAGQPFGIQKTAILGMSHLRLEKGHILPGHDTDAKTTLFEAGLGFAWDRKNRGFVGEAALKQLEQETPKRRLVRFSVDGRSPITPACKLVVGDRTVGSMPSVHFSRALNKTIGISLAEQCDGLVTDGEVSIKTDEGLVAAHVIKGHAFFDAAGKRMKT